MEGESGNTKCYAVELCEKWEIQSKIMLICEDCQIINRLSMLQNPVPNPISWNYNDKKPYPQLYKHQPGSQLPSLQ